MLFFVSVYALISIGLAEYAIRKLEPVKKYYENKPVQVDIMRRWDIPQWKRPILYLGSFLLIPRVFLIICCVVFHWLCTRISMIGVKITENEGVPPLRRKIFCFFSRTWARLLLFGLGFFYISTKGDPETCPVIACNHSSWIDIIYFLTSPEVPSFVSKASVKSMPCVGSVATAMQCIFIERTKDKSSALRALKDRQQIIHKGFPKLLVFPEGTTTNGTGLMEFKRGGFIQKLPVQPICIQYEGNFFSPCFEVVPMIPHVLMMVCQFYSKMTVHRLPVVYPPNECTSEEYAEIVRTKIAEHLNVPKVCFKIEEKMDLLSKIFKKEAKEF